MEEELKVRSQQMALALPDFSNPAIAARAWADAEEKHLAAVAACEGGSKSRGMSRIGSLDYPPLMDKDRRSITPQCRRKSAGRITTHFKIIAAHFTSAPPLDGDPTAGSAV